MRVPAPRDGLCEVQDGQFTEYLGLFSRVTIVDAFIACNLLAFLLSLTVQMRAGACGKTHEPLAVAKSVRLAGIEPATSGS